MIRVVSLRKASLAGVAGALAWTAVLGALDLLGLPLFDIVKALGTLAFSADDPLAWGALGLVAHSLVGICWALVYAYFFWASCPGLLRCRGSLGIVPATLALFIVNPQFHLMHPSEVVGVALANPASSITLAQFGGLSSAM